MALTIAAEAITDWTAVADQDVVHSSEVDISANFAYTLHIQAGLTSTTANTGTKFIVQVSSQSSGDEDWNDFTSFVELVGTAVEDTIEDNPLAVGASTITLTGHSMTTEGIWLFIDETGTPANSELVFLEDQTTNQLELLDVTTNSHANTIKIYNIAFTKLISIPMGVGLRARLVVDNSYDSAASSLKYKVSGVETTAVS